MAESRIKKQKRIARQTWHRRLNTFVTLCVLSAVALGAWKGPEIKQGIDQRNEIEQLMQDEGLRYTAYKDSLGNGTIGFGHLILPGDKFGTLTALEAIQLLKVDYQIASNSVARKYPWASGEVRLVLTNMTYQLGPNRLSKFKDTITALRFEEYEVAAAEMLTSRWARQAPRRAQRLAGRILSLEHSWL